MQRVSARECAKKGGVGVLPQKFLDFTYAVRLILTQCGHFYNVMCHVLAVTIYTLYYKNNIKTNIVTKQNL